MASLDAAEGGDDRAAGDAEEGGGDRAAGARLCELCAGGDKNLDEVKALLASGAAPAAYQEEETGASALMAAAGGGSLRVCAALLEAGAPWNALDRRGRCAGEYAVDAGHQEIVDHLVTAGVSAELLFGAVDRNQAKRRKIESAATAAVDTSTSSSSSSSSSSSGGGTGEAFDAHFPARPGMYLEDRGVRYDGDKLLDSADDAVMMAWETPLMEAHADILMAQNLESFGDVLAPLGVDLATSSVRPETSISSAGSSSSSSSANSDSAGNSSSSSSSGRSVLNIGFGMGIIDGALQERIQHRPGCRHTIVEAHPAVFAKMVELGWGRKEGVTLLFGRWQDVLCSPRSSGDGAAPAAVAAAAAAATDSTAAEEDRRAAAPPPPPPQQDLAAAAAATATWDGEPFDGVFFDTYGERYSDMSDFHDLLPRIVKPGGVYSFFNGMCPFNIFFHGVACELVKTELAALGFRIVFVPLQIQLDPSTWDGVNRKYWQRDVYYLPVSVRTALGGAAVGE